MKRTIASGLKLSVFNLVIVALLGMLMRYKIAFSFPIADQKFMLESHFHFAFYGWITSCIYMFILKYLQEKKPDLKKTGLYRNLITINFVAAYGMLVSFFVAGYSWASISFILLGLLVSLVFSFTFFTGLKGVSGKAKIWFQTGLIFAVLSSIGAFSISYMLMTKSVTADGYLASHYFFLHFQYNGFFLFSCIGLIIYSLSKRDVHISKEQNRIIFWLMFFGCLFGYGLSVLWMNLPLWIYLPIVIAAIMQTVGSVKIYLWIKGLWTKIKEIQSPIERALLTYAGAAFAIKIVLQLGSTIPSISHFAFGFRNIVIAYLHLILLMCISSFLLSRIIDTDYFKITKPFKIGIVLFMIGVFLNELMLGIVGLFSFTYTFIPYTHEILLVITVLIFISTLMIFLNMKKVKA